MWKKLTPPVVTYWNDLLISFSHAEAETLVALLSRLLARMEELPVKTPVKGKAA
jgi:hypothetical protein